MTFEPDKAVLILFVGSITAKPPEPAIAARVGARDEDLTRWGERPDRSPGHRSESRAAVCRWARQQHAGVRGNTLPADRPTRAAPV